MKFFLLIAKNVRRNLLRSILTALGTMVLVLVVTLVWSILSFLDLVTAEKKQDLKAIVSERWAIPSRMPFTYAESLARGAARSDHPEDVKPLDSMTWQFYVGSTDPAKLTRENLVVTLALEPDKLATMMEGLDKDSLSGSEKAALDDQIRRLKENRRGVIMGRNQLANMNKRVGDRVQVTGIGDFKGLDFEFEILGVFPPGRYDGMGAINRDYYNNTIDQYPRTHNGRKHLLADRNLSLVWLKLPDTDSFNRMAAQIESSPLYMSPALKCETAASGIATWIEAFRDLIWGARWLLAPACLVTLSLVIANAISISVRERRTELAVLKVLGFRPAQILVLVLGESLLLGAGAGFVSAALTYFGVNWGLGGVPFPIGFFPRFFIPLDALWWGAAVGTLSALVGSFLPAWAARNVKVADVFSKVA
jgi:putative ABC transport system permease protein